MASSAPGPALKPDVSGGSLNFSAAPRTNAATSKPPINPVAANWRWPLTSLAWLLPSLRQLLESGLGETGLGESSITLNRLHLNCFHHISHVTRRIPERLHGLRLSDAIDRFDFQIKGARLAGRESTLPFPKGVFA